jgi:hypothetical protein
MQTQYHGKHLGEAMVEGTVRGFVRSACCCTAGSRPRSSSRPHQIAASGLSAWPITPANPFAH